ncbi:hypothetical protein ACJQWK_11714 [Exserohilum turcicum]
MRVGGRSHGPPPVSILPAQQQQHSDSRSHTRLRPRLRSWAPSNISLASGIFFYFLGGAPLQANQQSAECTRAGRSITGLWQPQGAWLASALGVDEANSGETACAAHLAQGGTRRARLNHVGGAQVVAGLSHVALLHLCASQHLSAVPTLRAPPA